MSTRLDHSFGAFYTLLERPRAAKKAVACLLVIHTLLLSYSAYVHSPTLNEPAHLVAGLSHWKFGRFDIYNVNPPLVKMVAALPVMAVGYNEDWSGFYEGPGARPEMGMGGNFVAANGERSFFLFMIARWACIPFSWLGMIVCFLWARDLYGRPAGVMAAAIWCFEPNILAHASLITPDAAATALGLAACYTFWRWLKQPSWTQAALTGVVLGLAELAKTTLILFYPLWPLMWFVYRWPVRSSMGARNWTREVGMLGLRMAIGLYVLNLGYGFENSFTQLKEIQFVSDLFTGEIRSDSKDSDIRGPKSVNRFSSTWFGVLPLPFPKNYVAGIDIQQKDFENHGQPSYLRGVWRDQGWWYYYLYACAIKVPLGLWLLGFAVIVMRFFRFFSSAPTIDAELPTSAPQHRTAMARDTFILLFPPLMIFTVVSLKTGFAEHMRYVLPTFPYFYVAVSQLVCRICLTKSSEGLYSTLPGLGRTSCWASLLPVSLGSVIATWIIVSSLCIYPHNLSYFNEMIGGPLYGFRHLLGSNFDWNQDHCYIASFQNLRDGSLSSTANGQFDETGGEHRSCIINFDPYRINRLALQTRRQLLKVFEMGIPLTYTQRFVDCEHVRTLDAVTKHQLRLQR